VTNIGIFAFGDCHDLSAVAIPNSVLTIGGGAFFGTRLTEVAIPTSVQSFCFSAFSATEMVSVQLPNSVTNIGDWAFSYCTNLVYVSLGDHVTRIGDGTFYSCINLAHIIIPDSVASIGSEAFALTALKEIAIPGNVSSIGPMAFSYTDISSVLIPGSLVDFRGGFSYCPNLTNIVISDGVRNLAQPGFSDCYNLTSVVIGRSVEHISYGVFLGCQRLRGVYFKGNAPSADIHVFDDDSNAIVYYLPRTTGWGATFSGRPTALWLPQMQTGNSNFGVWTNQFGFTVDWASGMTLVVEASTNLSNGKWEALQTNTLAMDSFNFSDPGWTNYPNRFYRVRWQ